MENKERVNGYFGGAVLGGRLVIITDSSTDGYFEGFFVDPCGFANDDAAFTAVGSYDALPVSLTSTADVLRDFFGLLRQKEIKCHGKEAGAAEADAAWKNFSYDHPEVIDDMNAVRAYLEVTGGLSQ